MPEQQVWVYPGSAVEPFKVGHGDHVHQVSQTFSGLYQDNQVVALIILDLHVTAHVQLTAQDRGDAVFLAGLLVLENSVDVSVVGYGTGGLADADRLLGIVLRGADAVELTA